MGDGAATRRRLLDAAAREFARYGIAGARVDRIAAEAPANKAQIYTWFVSKDGLFDAVFREHLDLIVELVPFDADDLPGYATRLYDAYLRRPEVVLLAVRARLERMPTGDLLVDASEDVARKLAAIEAAQAAGVIDPALPPREVYSLVIAMSMAWSPASVTTAAAVGDDEATHAARRAALAAAVRGAFAPAS